MLVVIIQHPITVSNLYDNTIEILPAIPDHAHLLELDMVCRGCIATKYEKFGRLLVFVKEIIEDLNEDDEIYDRNVTIKIGEHVYTKAQFYCDLIVVRGEDLLKEIGEGK